ncbi:MAG TPA: superoxide dismutase [Cu-Zn] SodC [Caulobacteraceae bacterium]|jgi:Cu-Zn family superoxide dismutase|nr:superoxide dismutase [Cu-Zn] SodC [Caulobacteraceae bacterium]
MPELNLATLAAVLGVALGAAGSAAAASVVVPMALATPTGPGAAIGSITATDTPAGVSFAVNLHGLPAGQHGFHVHANPSCAPTTNAQGVVTPAGGAGAHLDPAMTNMHMGPAGMGHLGDLPLIVVAADGTSYDTVVAHHIASVADLKGHALMIHAGGDNYADTPAPLGGGGARLACGVAG